jgi:hypothetical protein
MKKLGKKEAISTFIRELKKKFPEVEAKAGRLEDYIVITAYTPTRNDSKELQMVEEMARTTTKILIKGGPLIVVVPEYRKKAA